MAKGIGPVKSQVTANGTTVSGEELKSFARGAAAGRSSTGDRVRGVVGEDRRGGGPAPGRLDFARR